MKKIFLILASAVVLLHITLSAEQIPAGEQYGMQFEIWKPLSGNEPSIGVGKDYGFYGYLRPADYCEQYKKYNICTDYTVCNETGTFKTQAHVRMFEKQLKANVEIILPQVKKTLFRAWA